MFMVVAKASSDDADKMASHLAVIFNMKREEIKSFALSKGTTTKFDLSLSAGTDEAVVRAVILLTTASGSSMLQAAAERIDAGKCYSSDFTQAFDSLEMHTLIPRIRSSLDQLSQIRDIKVKIKKEIDENDSAKTI